jgi:hypothetical protein
VPPERRRPRRRRPWAHGRVPSPGPCVRCRPGVPRGPAASARGPHRRTAGDPPRHRPGSGTRSTCGWSSSTSPTRRRSTRRSRGSSRRPAGSTSSCTTPGTWCSARQRRSPRAAGRGPRHRRAVHPAGQPRRAAAPAGAGRRPAGVGRLEQHPGRDAAVPGALLRRQGHRGLPRGQLHRRAGPLRHRDHDRRPGGRSRPGPTTSPTPARPGTPPSSRPTSRATPG